MNADKGRWLGLVGAAFVLSYAALAGCYTLRNFDLGWQLAAGRYIYETRTVPVTDVFSYTAAGKEFVYPPGSQLLLYLLYRLGGYPALSLLGVLACVATAAMALFAHSTRQQPAPSLLALWLVMLALPSIAARTNARADIFTTVLFTAALALASRYWLGVGGRLYLLPFLFVIWANLHQGFIFGMALFGPLLATVRDRIRLRHVLLAGAASGLAVLISPWGWRLYTSLWTVRGDMAFQRGFIAEASGVPWGWWRLGELLRLHDPDSSFWLLAALSLAGAVMAAARRQWMPLLVLVGALYLALSYARAQALLAIAAAILLPAVVPSIKVPRAVRAGAAAALGLLLCLRSLDLVSDRYYIARGDTATFGLGISWWFPERALDFMERERLPARLYHDYNLGGWVMWRLWPAYQVYIDGRASPFSPQVFLEQQGLMGVPPGSPPFQEFLDRRGINTLLVSLARYGGYRISPAALCAAPEFRLVYMDEISGVWVREKPENRAWLDRLARPCPSEAWPAQGTTKALRYNFLANAGHLYWALGRDDDAVQAFQEAEQIFREDAALRLTIAELWLRRQRWDQARREYRYSLSLRDSAPAWLGLAQIEAREGRHREAAEAFERAAVRSVLPHESYRLLGESYLALGQPERALKAFQKARATSRYRGAAEPLGRDFLAAVSDGERRARQMSPVPR